MTQFKFLRIVVFLFLHSINTCIFNDLILFRLLNRAVDNELRLVHNTEILVSVTAHRS